MSQGGETAQENEIALGPSLDPNERRVLFAAFDSLKQYRRAAHYNVTHRRRQDLYSLRSSHVQLLTSPPVSLLETLSRVDDAIDSNADIAEAILRHGLRTHGMSMDLESGNWQGFATSRDLEKAHATLRQIFRDWSTAGEAERRPIHDYVMENLTKTGGRPAAGAPGVRVLVPGSGLGRLLYEICKIGFNAEGNELSHLQLLASNWIIRHSGAAPWPLYPFASQFSNLVSRSQQVQRVMIPDVFPERDLSQAAVRGEHVGEMTMTAADFVVLYSKEQSRAVYDAVVTAFFIDTAPNFLHYVDTVINCLKLHGKWINVGPLLWHADVSNNSQKRKGGKGEDQNGNPATDSDEDIGIGEAGSVALTNEEVIWLLEKKGFRIENQQLLNPGVGYIQDPDGMLQHSYRASCWVAIKEIEHN